ncbi:MAG TPA: GAF domain-containing protein [Candidatus Aquilonibacter sp.]|nr:GAF domain-containing protein [Candidatus Aquilonibacter sp.]
MRAVVRILIAFVFCVGAVNLVASMTHLRDNGTFGFSSAQSAEIGNPKVTVTTVVPDSPAARAGIRSGDTLTYARSAKHRIIIGATVPGDRMTFERNGSPITLTAVVDEGPVPWALFIVAILSKIAFLVIGALIAWRRPRDDAALALSVFLVCFGAAIDYDTVVFPSLAVRFVSFVFLQSAFAAGGIGVLAFACWFPERATSGTRRILERLIVPCAIVALVSTIISFYIAYFARSTSGGAFASNLYLWNYLVMIAATMTALVTSYRESVRDQRARMRWVLGTLAVGFSGLAVLFVLLAFRVETAWGQYVSLTILAIPFGLGYVILRHRVIDMGFVINRAVVYTFVSLVVVGTFIIFEWLLGHIVEENSRASTLLALGGALALGLSARFIHARVDRWVDDLFFRDRHAAEAAIRRFAHEAAMITDPDVLIARTVEVAQHNARMNGAAFYARLGARYTPLHSSFPQSADLDENDPAILDMRTFHEPVDLTGGSGVPGVSAFPMMVRGQLAGFLACGEKTTHEAFAPDESDALRVLARDAGIALDSLRVSRIEQELAYLSADGELPTAIRLRLSSLLRREDGTQPAGAVGRSIQ